MTRVLTATAALAAAWLIHHTWRRLAAADQLVRDALAELETKD